MKNHSQNTSLPVRDAALGVLFATVGALVLIAVLGALASLAPSAEARALKSLPHQFPVKGKHTYGDGVGAGRGHQGQDLFSKCGNHVRAARGGRVQLRDRHSSAGNYLVVDGRNTRVDYVYMHLRGKPRVRKGQNVKKGEWIGRVGSSGNAAGCHLHFELWSKPGWYEGGHPLRSVTRHLRRWDRTS